jgi:hypothetical protein
MMLAFIFITSFISRDSFIPEEVAVNQLGLEPNFTDFDNPNSDGSFPRYHVYSTTFTEHMLICNSFLGWILFSVFAGFGLIALPWDLFVDYFYRPKPIDEGNFNERKELLLQFALELRETGKKLEEDRNFVSRVRGFPGLL